MKKAIKTMTRFLAVFLSVLFILEILPTQIMADAYSEYTNKKQFISDLISNPAEPSKEAYADIAYEDTDKRDEYTKVYKRNDGSFTAVVSQTPLHYLSNGNWLDIDNSLESKNGVLTNKENSYNVSFPQNISENNSISIENGGSEISFAVNNFSSSKATVDNNTAKDSSDINEADEEIANNESKIIYSDTDSNTDIEYIVLPNAVKENIVVSDADDVKNAYSFTLEIGNLTYIQAEDGSISFYDNNSLKFKIPKPLMYDSDFSYSYNIDVSLIDNNDGSITLTYTPDSSWINDKSRVYPVSIDPAIIMSDNSASWVEDAYVYTETNNQNAADFNGYDASAGIVGTYSDTTGEVYTKINTNAFTDLSENTVVLNATYAYGGGLMTPGKLYLKELTSPVNLHTVTYNTKPTSFGDTIDYYTSPLNQGDEPASAAIHFDITEAFTRWLRGETNNGFALIGDSNTGALVTLNGYFTILNNQYTTSTVMLIDYVYANSQSSDFSYHSQSIGRAGEGYVNDFSRSFSLLREDISLDGNIMPVSIQSIYNGGNADEDSIYGRNWQNSFQRMLIQTSEYSCAYLTEDGDIIDYTFEMDNGNVTFEEVQTDSGYLLSLLPIPDNYSGNYIDLVQVTEPNGYLERFDSDGYLISVTNPDYTAQHINLTYETVNDIKRIDYITDGVGRKFDYIYSQSTGLLTEINCLSSDNSQVTAGTTNAPLKVTYTYDNNENLTAVSFADGKAIHYSYDNNNRLISAENIDGYKIEYTYINEKISAVTEKALNGNSYVDGNSITYTETSPFEISLTDSNDLTETYFFNHKGECIYTTDSNGNYSFSGSNDSFFLGSGDYKAISKNILRSPSFETLSGWLGSNYSSVETSDARTGSKVVKLNDNNGDKNIYQTVYVSGNDSYTFSAYIRKAEDISNTDGTFKLNIKGYDSSNTLRYNEDEEIANLTTDWQRFKVSIDNRLNHYALSKITVTISSTSTNTEILIDDAQLESSVYASDFNILENGSFTNSDNIWNISGTHSVVTDGNKKALKFDGGADSLNTALSSVSINGHKGDVFTAGGFFKGKFVKSEKQNPIIDVLLQSEESDPTNYTGDRYAQIEISYQYEEEDENQNIQTLTDTVTIPFLQYLADWQLVADSFELKGDTDTLNVLIRYSKNANPGMFTDIFLNKEYDAISLDSSETETIEDTCPCEGCEEINCTCNCVDEEHCNCIQCKRKSSIETKDSFGNITSSSSFDGLKYISSSQSYSNDGNYLLSETDANGNTTSYAVNTLNGIISAITDPNNNTTNYSYDAYNLLTAVYTLNSQNEVETTANYTYTNDRLTAITHNGFVYNISYDIWGQISSFSVGNQPIVSYFYGDTNHRDRLNLLIYHNGSSTPVTGLDQTEIESRVNAGDAVFEYFYTDAGLISQINEYKEINDCIVPCIKYSMAYDSMGNTESITEAGIRKVEYFDGRTTIRNTNDDIIYTSYLDDNDNLVEVIGGDRYTTTDYDSSYDISTGITEYKSDYAEGNGKTIGTISDSDWFGRTTQELVKTESADDENPSNSFAAITTSYAYPTLANDKTSDRVSYITNRVTYGTDTSSQTAFYGFSYDYDSNGNITAEYTRDTNGTNTLIRSYLYDNLNQLIRVNEVGGKTYTFEYDNAGNLLSRKEYSYTTGDLTNLTPTSTLNYNYDSVWKDRLSSVGNTSFVYDNIGNPVSIGNDTLSWEGRALKSYTKRNTTYTYSYDENGLRHRKTVTEGGTVTATYDYVWSGGKLISQKYTDNTNNITYSAKFIYSSGGDIQGFIYNNTVYLYVKNLMGDIVAIIDENGNEVLKIKYDAWGKPLFILGELNNSSIFTIIQNISSFTYRGYCYDGDIGLYYLQSRYYSPTIGRFINTDDTNIAISTVGDILGANLFAYCDNNPVNCVDPTGYEKVVVNVYEGPIGHTDIQIGDYIYGYSSNSKNYLKKVTGCPAMLLVIRNRSKWFAFDYNKHKRKIRSIDINVTGEEILYLLTFYLAIVSCSTRITDVKYKGNGKTDYLNKNGHWTKYLVKRGKYVKYKLLSVNCTTVVCDALRAAMPETYKKAIKAWQIARNASTYYVIYPADMILFLSFFSYYKENP